MSVLDLPCLVLDSAHKPAHFVSVRNSIESIFSNKSISIEDYDKPVRSVNFSMNAPKVVIGYYGMFRNKAKYSKLNVLYRDSQICQYCGKQFSIDNLNVEHIVPQSKFKAFLKNPALHSKFLKTVGIDKIPQTKNDWLNTVCTCLKCNNKKQNKYLWDTSFKLFSKPFVPKYTPRIVMSIEYAEKIGFLPYLEPHNDGMTVRLFESRKK